MVSALVQCPPFTPPPRLPPSAPLPKTWWGHCGGSALSLWGRTFRHAPHRVTQLKGTSTSTHNLVMEKPGTPTPPQK